jgi:Zn-dependent oligopeptidase
MNMNNPLETTIFNTPFNAIPFEEIKLDHFLPAIKSSIKVANEELSSLTSQTDEATFENTIEKLDIIGEQLGIVSGVFFNLNSAETSEEMQKLAQEIFPLLTEHSNDVLLNEVLFERIKTVYETKEQLELNKEASTLLDKTYKRFARNGALLQGEKKDKLRELNKGLSLTSLKFGENVLAESNSFELLLTDKKDLDGLPESAIEAAAQLAKEKEKQGWLITLDYPSYIPFITYSNNRKLREQLFRAFSSKANQGNEFDNKKIVVKIAQLRFEKAQLLGYDSHAHYILEERMAKSSETVKSFLNELLEKSLPASKKEKEELQQFATSIGGPKELQRWDASYYSEKLKIQQLNFDEEKLKPYFQLEKVVDGVFEVANKLYGLTFKENNKIQVYHPEVTAYEVYDENNDFLALFYADFFPRKGKRQGAWMTSFKGQYHREGTNHRPHISIVCNFTKPTETKPSLLTFNEVTTLFHEFGHALHGMLANGTYESLSGTNVSWDFVELPSQILENWCYEKECLDLFAKHYETGETIPTEYIQQIQASLKFQSGLFSLRQISFGLLDMAWHDTDPSSITDPIAYESQVSDGTSLYPKVEGSCMSTQFSHIFQGGYSAGYYSYKWAEVLDADAFESFQTAGIFDKKTASSFKNNILSKGGSENPELLYEQFKGRKPSPDALLKRSGLM